MTRAEHGSDHPEGWWPRHSIEHAEADQPGSNSRADALVTVVAVAIPLVATGAVLAFRDRLVIAGALIIVIGAMVGGWLAGLGAGAAAGILAAIAIHWLVRPDAGMVPLVDGGDDALTSVIAVAAAVGAGLAGRERMRDRDRLAARARELDVLRAWAGRSARTGDRMFDDAGADLARLLAAVAWTWEPGAGHHDDLPSLYDDGTLSGRVGALGRDRRVLPPRLAVPIVAAGRPVGRFVMQCGDRGISIEERRAAGSIVQRLERELDDGG